MNTWPAGKRRVLSQAKHTLWNASHYPGTAQLCARCLDATERCEEDSIYLDGEAVCESCAAQAKGREG